MGKKSKIRSQSENQKEYYALAVLLKSIFIDLDIEIKAKNEAEYQEKLKQFILAIAGLVEMKSKKNSTFVGILYKIKGVK